MADSLWATLVHMTKRDLARARAKLPSMCNITRSADGFRVNIKLYGTWYGFSPQEARGLADILQDADRVVWIQGMRDGQIRREQEAHDDTG